jgi:hypothetical protein
MLAPKVAIAKKPPTTPLTWEAADSFSHLEFQSSNSLLSCSQIANDWEDKNANRTTNEIVLFNINYLKLLIESQV